MTKRAFRYLSMILIIIGSMVVCRFISEHLFSSYYAMEWGTSAQIMHSPPFGENYINKLSIVSNVSLFIGALLGIVLGIVLHKRLK